MKNIILILLVSFASGCAFAQQAPNNTNGNNNTTNNNGTVVGIRIGSTSSGKVDLSSDGEAIAGYVIYNNSGDVVRSGSLSLTYHALIDTSSLPSGAYYVVAVGESGEAVADTYFKQ